MPEKKLPSVEDILNFSVNYVCGLFETNKDERGVLYEKISPAGERSLIRRFSLRDKISQTFFIFSEFAPCFWRSRI